jgi:23S rRNA pseudouridine1911/1915/1917 synthase
MENKRTISVTEGKKERVDIYIKSASGLSRGQAQKLIDAGHVSLNGKKVMNYHTKVKGGDILEYTMELPEPFELKPADIAINIIYEDDDIIVVNKHAGLVVHPAPGHDDDTLVNALLGKHIKSGDFSSLAPLRPGVVHRLDKDTSGVMVVAKSEKMRVLLSSLFKKKDVKKIYNCLVHGRIENEGKLSTLIDRDKRDRKKFTAKGLSGKEANTVFLPLENFYNSTLLEVRILTGRTHQIRVHMNYMKHEVLGDPMYGDKNKDNQLVEYLGYDRKSAADLLPRQMLHARELEFVNPVTGKKMNFKAPLPEDFERILGMLRKKQG